MITRLTPSYSEKVAALSEHVDKELRTELQQLVTILPISNTPTAGKMVLLYLCRLSLKLMEKIYEPLNEKFPDDRNLFSLISKVAIDGPNSGDIQELSKALDGAITRLACGDADRKIKGLKVMPDTIASILHNVRVFSNKVDHAAEKIRLGVGEAEYVLTGFLRVMEWFYSEYEYGPKLRQVYIQELLYVHPIQSKVTRQEHIIGERLPDIGDIFKDRIDNISEIQQHLINKNVKLINIIGRGGIGKTALLCKVCSEIEVGCLGISESSDPIGVDGMIYVDCHSADKPTLESFFHYFGEIFGSPVYERLIETWKSPTLSVSERVYCLLNLLKKGNYLLVLDNLEDLLSPVNSRLYDEDLRTFVEIVLKTRNHGLKIIATCRERIIVDVMLHSFVRHVSVEGLPEEDAVALLRDLDHEGMIGLRDESEELLRIAVKSVFCVPWGVLRIAGNLFKFEVGQWSLRELLQNEQLFNEEVLQNLVELQYRRISDKQRRVLEALSVFSRPVRKSVIVELVNSLYSQIDVSACLGCLVRNLFVRYDSHEQTFYLHPLDRQFAYTQIPEESETDIKSKSDSHKSAAGICLRQPAANEEEAIEWQIEAWDHFLRGGHLREAAGLLETMVFPLAEVHTRSDLYLSMVDRLMAAGGQISPKALAWKAKILMWSGDMVSALELMRDQASKGNDYARGTALEALAYFYADLGEYETAKKCANESVALLRQSSDREMLALALKTLGYVSFYKHEPVEALQNFEECLEIRNQVARHRSEAGIELGRTYHLLGDLDKAVSYSLSLFELYSAYRWSRFHGVLALATAADAEVDRGYYETAEELCKKAIKIAEQSVRQQKDVAVLQRVWARAKRSMRNCKEACELLERSRQTFESQRLPYELALTMKEIGITQEMNGDYAAAQRAYECALNHNLPITDYYCSVRLGMVYLKSEALDLSNRYFAKGMEHCVYLLEKNPELYDPLYFKGLAELSMGQAADSLRDYRKALTLCHGRGILEAVLQDLQYIETTNIHASEIKKVKALVEGALSSPIVPESVFSELADP